MHPIDVAYKRTADEIGEKLSKIKVEVGAIELLATTKIAKLYDGKIAALRASAATMESQVSELQALIGEDCSAVGGEDTAPSKEEQNPLTPSEWNSLACERNATRALSDQNNAVSMRGLDELASRISKVKVDLGEMELLATTIGATPYVGQVTALRGSVFDTESRINELNARINELKSRSDKLSSRFNELKSRYNNELKSRYNNELSSLINGHSCAVRDDDTLSSEKKEQPANVSDLETAVRKLFKAGYENPFQPE
ncbi:MAG: hypothetical protein OHK93_008445 [Ramalina farinacea]|uniref:Uncharacterized protein n=1 Tax=Ramalina farinacea TaxID=258253 RepID=A0AA43TYI4_9LECA|nr:hypothetical protein [Ramalina farinacea]